MMSTKQNHLSIDIEEEAQASDKDAHTIKVDVFIQAGYIDEVAQAL
jgi:hypothetical protein